MNELPVDQGWAWVIVTATCSLWTIQSGAVKAQGIILVELKEIYQDVPESSLLWIFGLSSVLCNASGMLVSWMIIKTSHRTTAMTGLVLMSLGVIGTAYVPNAWLMYVTFGVCYGVGSGMVGLTAMLGTGPYFNKRKAMAIGITAAGSGLGTILLPNLLRFLFDNMDFSASLLLYAACILQILVVAALMRPPSFYATVSQPMPCDSKISEKPELLENSEPKRLRSATFHGRKRHSTLNIDDFFSLQDVDQHTHKSSWRSRTGTMLPMVEASAPIISTLLLSPDDDETSASLQHSFNWRVVTDYRTVMLGVSMLFYQCGTGVVYPCIAPLAKSSGVDKTSVALALTIAGIVEIPLRIFNGWLADRHIMTALTQFICNITLAGVSACLCATISGLAGMLIMVCGMSSVGSSVFNLLPIVCAEILGEENVISAMGVQWVYQSVAFAITTPIVGAIYDQFGFWEPVYYYIATVMWTASLLTGSYCFYQRCQQNKQRQHISETVATVHSDSL